MKRLDVFRAIDDEREAQLVKWGEQHHDPDRWNTILTEETGEAAKEVNEGDHQKMVAELIQVAAVAVAWLEDWA